ncbi:hypothetical protein Trydic_g6719 [Trypoxylus dichotomus]
MDAGLLIVVLSREVLEVIKGILQRTSPSLGWRPVAVPHTKPGNWTTTRLGIDKLSTFYISELSKLVRVRECPEELPRWQLDPGRAAPIPKERKDNLDKPPGSPKVLLFGTGNQEEEDVDRES